MKDFKDNILIVLNRMTEWSLCILIFSLPFSKSAVEICAIIAITTWLTRKVLCGKKALRLAHTDLNMPIALFYSISFFSIFWSSHPAISISAFWRKLTEYILLYFIIVETATEKRVIRNILFAIAVSVIIVCADGIYQKFTGHDFIRGYALHSLERITASFKFPNGLSSWLLVVTFPFICLATFYRKNVRLQIFLYVSLILLGYCLFFGLTRAAFISFVLAFGFMLILIGSKRQRVVSVAVILCVFLLIIFLPQNIKDQIYLFKIFSGSSTQHRIKVLTTAWKMFTNKPYFGHGLNTFMANYAAFRAPDEQGIWYAHNSYLQIAAELGIFGLFAFMWMILKMAFVSARSWRLINDDFLKYLFLGLFCGITAYLVFSSVEVTHFSLQSAVIFYFSLGLLIAIKNIGLTDLRTNAKG